MSIWVLPRFVPVDISALLNLKRKKSFLKHVTLSFWPILSMFAARIRSQILQLHLWQWRPLPLCLLTAYHHSVHWGLTSSLKNTTHCFLAKSPLKSANSPSSPLFRPSLPFILVLVFDEPPPPPYKNQSFQKNPKSFWSLTPSLPFKSN